MPKRSCDIVTVLLLVLLLFVPSVIRLEHHHKYIEYINDGGLHYYPLHHECFICNFEFANVIPVTVSDICLKIDLLTLPLPLFKQEFFQNNPDFSFSLRAPPNSL